MSDARIHDSDCALHNAPALPVGPCDCSASQHSPGPWDVRDALGPEKELCFHEIWSGKKIIASTWGKPHEANARLIAAAPDLIAAILNSDDEHWTPAMRAAIAKATTP